MEAGAESARHLSPSEAHGHIGDLMTTLLCRACCSRIPLLATCSCSGMRRTSASQLDSALMDIDLAALPNDVETLQKLVRSLAAERTSLSEAQAEIERLHLIIGDQRGS
jgi:hypothetical protein